MHAPQRQAPGVAGAPVHDSSGHHVRSLIPGVGRHGAEVRAASCSSSIWSRGPIQHDPAELHERDDVGDLQHLVRLLLDEQDRRSQVAQLRGSRP